MPSAVLVDVAGRRRSPATLPRFHEGRPPRNKGLHYPADPPSVEKIIAVMRAAGDDAEGVRLRGLIIVLWVDWYNTRRPHGSVSHTRRQRPGLIAVLVAGRDTVQTTRGSTTLDIYDGPGHEVVVGDELGFLRRHLVLTTRHHG